MRRLSGERPFAPIGPLSCDCPPIVSWSHAVVSTTTLRSTGATYADVAGIAASVACAIHCAAMPLVIGYLPLMGLDWLAGESFHRWMAAVCFVLAASAFVPGWKKHRTLTPGAIGLAGVTLLLVAAWGFADECCASDAPGSGTAATETACAGEACPHCLAAEKTSAAATEPPAMSAAWMIPLLTPLGGVLLVLGHVVNHVRACRCQGDQCCLPPSSWSGTSRSDVDGSVGVSPGV